MHPLGWALVEWAIINLQLCCVHLAINLRSRVYGKLHRMNVAWTTTKTDALQMPGALVCPDKVSWWWNHCVPTQFPRKQTYRAGHFVCGRLWRNSRLNAVAPWYVSCRCKSTTWTHHHQLNSRCGIRDVPFGSINSAGIASGNCVLHVSLVTSNKRIAFTTAMDTESQSCSQTGNAKEKT